MWVEIGIWVSITSVFTVTPSRVCELKLIKYLRNYLSSLSHPHGCVSWNLKVSSGSFKGMRHTLTGVWVEIFCACSKSLWTYSHTLTGVWVEIAPFTVNVAFFISHTLTGVWVEISWSVCGFFRNKSHPHGCVSWNTPTNIVKPNVYSHTLTGVWVEIPRGESRESALYSSHPHGCVSWNYKPMTIAGCLTSHTLTGVWVEIRGVRTYSLVVLSHPHGCVSWNWIKYMTL